MYSYYYFWLYLVKYSINWPLKIIFNPPWYWIRKPCFARITFVSWWAVVKTRPGSRARAIRCPCAAPPQPQTGHPTADASAARAVLSGGEHTPRSLCTGRWRPLLQSERHSLKMASTLFSFQQLLKSIATFCCIDLTDFPFILGKISLRTSQRIKPARSHERRSHRYWQSQHIGSQATAWKGGLGNFKRLLMKQTDLFIILDVIFK